MKFITLTTFRCTVHKHSRHSHTSAAIATTSRISHLPKLKPGPRQAPLPEPWHCHLLPVSMSWTPVGTCIKWNPPFCVWLISLNLMSSRFLRVVAGVRIWSPF